MKRMRLLVAAGCAVTFSVSALAGDPAPEHYMLRTSAPYSKARTAIEPSHWGKYGNPEEPATRPFKAFWRGLKAMKYQFKESIYEGEAKAGSVGGAVQGFRGIRRGVVELGASTYMGMAGQYPKPVEQTHPVNVYIDSDRRLAALADIPTTSALFFYGGAGSVGAVFGPGAVTVAQSEVDRYAMPPEERAEIAQAAARFSKQQWPSSPQDRNTARPEGLKYTGEWKATEEAAKAQHKKNVQGNPYSGDMIKKARAGSIR